MASDMNGASRRSSVISGATARPNHSRRYYSMPHRSAGTILPRQGPVLASATSDHSTSRNASPSPYSKHASSTPTPGSRPQRPTTHPSDNKPRWNSSPKVDYIDFSLRPKPLALSTPPNRKSPMSFRSPRSASYSSSNVPFPSPLSRSDFSSPAPTPTIVNRQRLSGTHTSLGNHDGGQISSSPAFPGQISNEIPRLRSKPQLNPLRTPQTASDEQSSFSDAQSFDSAEDSSPSLPKTRRPATALANGGRLSMLPVPKTSPSVASHSIGREFSAAATPTVSNGRDIVVGPRSRGGRESVLGRDRKWR